MVTQRDKRILRFIEDFGGITINQCSKIFFRDTKHPYDLARKRLKKIAEMTDLRYFTNKLTGERVYCHDKRLTPHTVFLYNVYAEFIHHDCKIIEFKKEPQYLDGARRADGFFEIEYNNGRRKIICVEIEVTYSTDFSKYDEIYKGGEFQSKYGEDAFPLVVNVGDLESDYSSENFEIAYLDYNLSNFVEKVLY